MPEPLIIIDLQKLRDALPKRALLTLRRKGDIAIVECNLEPGLNDKDFHMVYQWQTLIIGAANIYEIFTDKPGQQWLIYLVKNRYKFTHMSDEDIRLFCGNTISPNDENPGL